MLVFVHVRVLVLLLFVPLFVSQWKTKLRFLNVFVRNCFVIEEFVFPFKRLRFSRSIRYKDVFKIRLVTSFGFYSACPENIVDFKLETCKVDIISNTGKLSKEESLDFLTKFLNKTSFACCEYEWHVGSDEFFFYFNLSPYILNDL